MHALRLSCVASVAVGYPYPPFYCVLVVSVAAAFLGESLGAL
jgi:hypothetical protein